MGNGSSRLPSGVYIVSTLSLLLLCVAGSQTCWADSISAVNDGPANLSNTAYHRGVSALAKNDLKEAERVFRDALRLQPAHIPSMLGLADVALKRGQTQAAENYLRQALKIEPKNADALRGLGRFFYSQKQYPRAEASFKQAIASAPKEALPLVDLAELYLAGLKQPEHSKRPAA